MKTSEDGRLCSLRVTMESPFVISVKCFTHIINNNNNTIYIAHQQPVKKIPKKRYQ